MAQNVPGQNPLTRSPAFDGLRWRLCASNAQMSPDTLAAFREFVEQEGQVFLENLPQLAVPVQRIGFQAPINFFPLLISALT